MPDSLSLLPSVHSSSSNHALGSDFFLEPIDFLRNVLESESLHGCPPSSELLRDEASLNGFQDAESCELDFPCIEAMPFLIFCRIVLGGSISSVGRILASRREC